MNDQNQEELDLGQQKAVPGPSKEDIALGNEIFEKILKGENITDEIQTNQGTFVIKYPLGRDFVEIDRRKALMRRGIPADQFDRTAEQNFEAYAALDVCVTDGPDWWKKLKNGTIDCPDQSLVNALYARYLQQFGEVQQVLKLSGTRELDGKRESSAGDKTKTVGGGLFQGLAFRIRNKSNK